MTYKITFHRILMTSVITITALFAQEAKACRRPMEENIYPDPFGINATPAKRPRYHEPKFDYEKQEQEDSDFALALQMEYESSAEQKWEPNFDFFPKEKHLKVDNKLKWDDDSTDASYDPIDVDDDFEDADMEEDTQKLPLPQLNQPFQLNSPLFHVNQVVEHNNNNPLFNDLFVHNHPIIRDDQESINRDNNNQPEIIKKKTILKIKNPSVESKQADLPPQFPQGAAPIFAPQNNPLFFIPLAERLPGQLPMPPQPQLFRQKIQQQIDQLRQEQQQRPQLSQQQQLQQQQLLQQQQRQQLLQQEQLRQQLSQEQRQQLLLQQQQQLQRQQLLQQQQKRIPLQIFGARNPNPIGYPFGQNYPGDFVPPKENEENPLHQKREDESKIPTIDISLQFYKGDNDPHLLVCGELFEFDMNRILSEEDKKLMEDLFKATKSIDLKVTAINKRICRYYSGIFWSLLSHNSEKFTFKHYIEQATYGYNFSPKKYYNTTNKDLIRCLEREPRPVEITLNNVIFKGVLGDNPLSVRTKILQAKENQIAQKHQGLQQQQQEQEQEQEQEQQMQLRQQQQHLLFGQNNQVVQPKTPFQQPGWRYSRKDARNATPQEALLYEEIRAKLMSLTDKVGPTALHRVLETIGDVETLHINNIEICEELFNGKMLMSKKFSGIVLHGEQSDSNLELRANNMYLTYSSVWSALKGVDKEELFIDFFQNGFVSSACLEGRTGSADTWHQKNMSGLKNIKLSFDEQLKQKTVEENIIEQAKVIFEQSLGDSKEGLKLKLLREQSAQFQALRDKDRKAIEYAANNPEQIAKGLDTNQLLIEALQSLEDKISPKFETKELYKKMFEKLKSDLMGKEAKDGKIITLEDIKDTVQIVLVWDLD